ncbi:hypothetical protein [Haladaptatus sp. NG-SE-30]
MANDSFASRVPMSWQYLAFVTGLVGGLVGFLFGDSSSGVFGALVGFFLGKIVGSTVRVFG